MTEKHTLALTTARSARTARPVPRRFVPIVRVNWFGGLDGEFLPTARKRQRIERKSKSEIVQTDLGCQLRSLDACLASCRRDNLPTVSSYGQQHKPGGGCGHGI